MRETVNLQEVQPHELRRGIEELVKESEPKSNSSQIKNKANWLYSLTMGAARVEAIKALAEYRKEQLTPIALIREKHNSKKLGMHLNAKGEPKPDKVYEAHAVISGRHKDAEAARIILARYNIRIDDPDNGVWLPNFKKHVPHESYPKAPAHRTIHTVQYYLNVTSLLERTSSEEEARAVLRKIGRRLQHGKFPYEKNKTIDYKNW